MHSRSPLVTRHQLYDGRQSIPFEMSNRALTGSCGLGCFPGRVKCNLFEAKCFVEDGFGMPQSGLECFPGMDEARTHLPCWVKASHIDLEFSATTPLVFMVPASSFWVSPAIIIILSLTSCING